MSDFNSEELSYGVMWMGGGPDAETPSGGQFDTEAELLEYLDQLNEDVQKGPDGPYEDVRRDEGLAVGDAEVYVYIGDPPDLESLAPGEAAEAVVKGKIDASVVLHNGGIEEDKLKDLI